MKNFFFPLVVLASIRYVRLEETNFRLPSIVVPSHYELTLAFARTVFTGTRTTYTGSLLVNLAVTEVASEIQLHSNPDYIRIKTVSFTAGPTGTSYNVEKATEILTVSTKTDLTPDVQYILKITYEADISTTDMFGVFRTSYLDGSDTKYMIATQFQPTYARRVFPCFDEPEFKATFTFIFNLSPNVLPISNTEVENSESSAVMAVYTFRKTPKLSTYKLAFQISEIICDEAVDDVLNIFCSVPALFHLRSYAVELAPKMLDNMNQYTRDIVDYNEIMNKLHYIVLPNSAFKSMDNWGLSTYREQYLLYDSSENTNVDKQNVAIAISEVIVQQWFGNLVTFEWWSDMFLNTGFGDYFKYSILSTILPEWELQKQYIVDNFQSALTSEEIYPRSLLIPTVSTPTEILLTLDIGSAKKAGSIFRMVENIMGADNFKKGISNYLNINKFETITLEKLWVSLETQLNNEVSKLPLEETLSTVMENWINEPGYPLVTVSVDGKNVTIKQENLSTQNDSVAEWYIPINYVTSLNILGTKSRTPQYWLKPNEVVSFQIPECATWVLVNYQQIGYYRVNYDEETLGFIESALKSPEFEGIDEISRAQLVDDVFSLARQEILSYSKVFKFLEFLVEDNSYFTWKAAFNGFETLLNSLKSDFNLTENIKTYVLNLMSNLYQSTPFDKLQDDHLLTLKQDLALKWACQFGHLECIGMSRALFFSYKLNSVRPPKELRSIVYCTALQQSNNNEDWLILWNDYTNSESDSERSLLLRSLACSTNTYLLKELLNRTLSENGEIRAEDRLIAFESVAKNPLGSPEAIDFFINNYQDLSTKYQCYNVIPNILQILASLVTNKEELEKLQTFIDGDLLPTEFVEKANIILENIQKSISRNVLYKQSINEYFHPSKSAADVTLYNSVILLIVSMLYLF